MTAEEAKAASIYAKWRGVDPDSQRLTIDSLIDQATRKALYEIEFAGLHPKTAEGLIQDGYLITTKSTSTTTIIAWR